MARKHKYKVFVSYSRHDEPLVRPLAGLLGVAAEDAVFLDVTSLKPGDPWDEKIISAVKEAPVFVLCWCCESNKSSFVAKEIATALSKGRKRLVPVLFCATPLPPELAAWHWIDLRGRVVHECPIPHEEDADKRVKKRQRKEQRDFKRGRDDYQKDERRKTRTFWGTSKEEHYNSKGQSTGTIFSSKGKPPKPKWGRVGNLSLLTESLRTAAYLAGVFVLMRLAYSYVRRDSGSALIQMLVALVALIATLASLRGSLYMKKRMKAADPADVIANRARSYFEGLAKKK